MIISITTAREPPTPAGNSCSAEQPLLGSRNGDFPPQREELHVAGVCVCKAAGSLKAYKPPQEKALQQKEIMRSRARPVPDKLEQQFTKVGRCYLKQTIPS